MKKIKNLLIIVFLIIFSSCESEEYELGELVNPSNLTVTVELQGQDVDNPFGDGSGVVTLSAIASDAITYKFVINEVEYLQPSGVLTTQFSNIGTNTYEVQVIASGTAGLMTESFINIEVLYSYQPPADLVQSLLIGNWREMAESDGHIGVHDAGSFHDGGNTFIQDIGTGDLVIGATHLRLRGHTTAETYFLGTENGSVELYHDGTKTFETISKGIQVGTSDTTSDSEIIIKSVATNGGKALLTMISDNAGDPGDGYQIRSLNGSLTIYSDDF